MKIMHRPSKDLSVAIGFTVGAIIVSALMVGMTYLSSRAFSSLSAGSSKPTEVPSFASYVAVSKGLYVWSHTTDSRVSGTAAWEVLLNDASDDITYLCAFCRQHGISSVYLFVGSAEWEWDMYFSQGKMPHQQAVRAAVTKLTKNGITTHPMVYLNDDPNNLANYERMGAIAEAVHSFKAANPELLIGSLHIDQEPSVTTKYADYIRMLTLASSKTPVSVAIKPLWTRTYLSEIEDAFNLFDLALEIDSLLDIQESAQIFSDVVYYVTNYSTMMAYSDVQTQVENLAAAAMDSAVRVNKAYTETAIETGYTNNLPSSETLHYNLIGDKAAWFDLFLNISAAVEEAAKERSLSHHVVIHDYAQYFYSLYCALPIAKPNIASYPYKDCVGSK